MMDDKLEEIVAKYSITVKSKKRSRGALLLETDLGLCLLKIYNSNIKRIEFEQNVKNALLQSGYQNVDYIIKNVDGEFVTKDNRGNSWILKNPCPATHLRRKLKLRIKRARNRSFYRIFYFPNWPKICAKKKRPF